MKKKTKEGRREGWEKVGIGTVTILMGDLEGGAQISVVASDPGHFMKIQPLSLHSTA
jgi:hypothetical protein